MTPEDDRFIVYTPAQTDAPQAYIAGGNSSDMSRSYYFITEELDQAEIFPELNAMQVRDDLNRGQPEIGIGVVPGAEGRTWMIARAPRTARQE